MHGKQEEKRVYEEIGKVITTKLNYHNPKSSEMIQLALLAERGTGRYFVNSGKNMLSLENFVEAKGKPDIECFDPSKKNSSRAIFKE